MEDRRFALGENFLDLESTNPQETISDSNRDITEDAGGDADLFLKGMNKVFLAVVADLIRDLLDGKPSRGQEVLGLVDAPQQDVFIGRVSGLGLEDAGEMGGAESCGGGGVPDGQRLMEAAVDAPEGCGNGFIFRLTLSAQKKLAQHPVNELRAGGFTHTRPGGTGIHQFPDSLDQGWEGVGSKDVPPAPALEDTAVQFPGVEAVEENPDLFREHGGTVLMRLPAVEEGHLSRSRGILHILEAAVQVPLTDTDEHQIFPMTGQSGCFRLMVEGIVFIAEIMAYPGGIVEQLLRQRRGSKEITLGIFEDARLWNVHGIHRPFACFL